MVIWLEESLEGISVSTSVREVRPETLLAKASVDSQLIQFLLSGKFSSRRQGKKIENCLFFASLWYEKM